MQKGMLRAPEERFGEENQGCCVGFHMEELFKVKMMEVFTANDF